MAANTGRTTTLISATFEKDIDSVDLLKQSNVGEILDRLADEGWLAEEKKNRASNERVKQALPLLKGIRIMQPLEYGRAVHAEMAAIVEAAVRGVPIRGGTLYTTTFPCHECARHIIAAGIARVVFIEPYPKSLAAQLHDDSIAVEKRGRRPSCIPAVDPCSTKKICGSVPNVWRPQNV